MNKKTSDFLLLTLVSVIILAVPLAWFLVPQISFDSVLEQRKLNTFPNASYFREFRSGAKYLLTRRTVKGSIWFQEQWIKRGFQQNIESASVDQFPLRINLTKVARRIEQLDIHLAYLPLDDPAIPASINRSALVMRDESRLIPFPKSFDDQIKTTIDLRLDNYKELIKRYPAINFYVFHIERLQDSKMNPVTKYFPEANNGRALQYFEQNKPEELFLGKMPIESYVEFEQDFFKTDHHWNIHGAWKGYEEIYRMLSQKYTDISPMLVPSKFRDVSGVKFCGSLSRQSLYPCHADILEYADVRLPISVTTVDDVRKPYGDKKKYLQGKFSENEYDTHYGRFFGGGAGIVKYSVNNDSKRSLLIIGDSYAPVVSEFIASHYQTTYLVDLRYLKTDFSLKKFLEDKIIDDVLVLGSDEVVFGSKKWMINP